jgi:hypothetical protein
LPRLSPGAGNPLAREREIPVPTIHSWLRRG